MRNWAQPDGVREAYLNDPCPKCHAPAVTAGEVIDTGYGVPCSVFRPMGTVCFLSLLFRRKQGVHLTRRSQACLSCGHVWAGLDPAELRAYIDKYGDMETKLKLKPFAKEQMSPGQNLD